MESTFPVNSDEYANRLAEIASRLWRDDPNATSENVAWRDASEEQRKPYLERAKEIFDIMHRLTPRSFSDLALAVSKTQEISRLRRRWDPRPLKERFAGFEERLTQQAEDPRRETFYLAKAAHDADENMTDLAYKVAGMLHSYSNLDDMPRVIMDGELKAWGETALAYATAVQDCRAAMRALDLHISTMAENWERVD